MARSWQGDGGEREGSFGGDFVEAAQDLSSWNGLNLSEAILEKGATTLGLFRVRVPIKSSVAFYKFVVKDEEQTEE